MIAPRSLSRRSLVAIVSCLYSVNGQTRTPAQQEQLQFLSRDINFTYNGCPTYTSAARLACNVTREDRTSDEQLEIGYYAVMSHPYQLSIPEMNDGRMAYCGSLPMDSKLHDPDDFRVHLRNCTYLIYFVPSKYCHIEADVMLLRQYERQLPGPASRNYVVCIAKVSNKTHTLHLTSKFLPLPLCPIEAEVEQTTADEPKHVPGEEQIVYSRTTSQKTTVMLLQEYVEKKDEEPKWRLLLIMSAIVSPGLLAAVVAIAVFVYWRLNCRVDKLEPLSFEALSNFDYSSAARANNTRSLFLAACEPNIRMSTTPTEHLTVERTAERTINATTQLSAEQVDNTILSASLLTIANQKSSKRTRSHLSSKWR